ncbi:MAG: right-handed parallel beta-helix repeat-containing protein [Oscillospiraceae bacterium]|jgi:hypothetical protein|nr:right-handed parallel beta-helix repeat-containing protein [Oscillospiraceae bacterium]
MKQRSGLQVFVTFLLGTVLAAALGWYYDVYTHWQPKVFPFAMALTAAAFASFAFSIVWGLEPPPRKAPRLLWKSALTFAAGFGALIGVTSLINNVLYHSTGAALAANIALPLVLVWVLLLLALRVRALAKAGGKKPAALLSAGLMLVFTGTGLLGIAYPAHMRGAYRAPIPAVPAGEFAPPPSWGDTPDFTVSPGGMTLEQARDAVRAARENPENAQRQYTVLLEGGEYSIQNITFDERDINTVYYAMETGVTFNGGLRLRPADFTEAAGLDARLGESASNIKAVDLTKLGLTAADWGEINAVGAYHTAGNYDGGCGGEVYAELFLNDTRCVLARYPNAGDFTRTGEIVRSTISDQPGSPARNERNLPGDIFRPADDTAARLAGYQSTDDVWLMGYWKYDWADASTPFTYDSGKNEITTAYASCYGVDADKPYYIFNALEELDAPGEWYLDRGAGMLYVYPAAGTFAAAEIDLSLSTQPIVQIKGGSGLRFQGITFKGTRGDALDVQGDGNVFSHCTIKNTGGWAARLDGTGNRVSDCEITHTGKGGVFLSGGEVTTLTPGNNQAVNNLIHDWAEVYFTYQPAVQLSGVGNVCAHNEMYNSPHEAISFVYGASEPGSNGSASNNHIIEYNLIHDVCLLSDDAGAIYGGCRWDAYGTAIRYNAIYNLGSGTHKPVGIYLDDALSGITVEGNLVVNAGNIGIQLGGGRDLTVRNNVVVNANSTISYDWRAREGAIDPNGWFSTHSGEGGEMWQWLKASPWQSETWQKAYPQMRRFSFDFSQPDSPDFVANPAYSVVTDNILVGVKRWETGKQVLLFSTLAPNAEYGLWRGHKYGELPGFSEKIPIERIGRTLLQEK